MALPTLSQMEHNSRIHLMEYFSNIIHIFLVFTHIRMYVTTINKLKQIFKTILIFELDIIFEVPYCSEQELLGCHHIKA